MTIKAAEVFGQVVLPARAVRAHIDGMLTNIETQRLVAWATWRADPDGTDKEGRKAQDTYRTLCREQARLMEAAAEWKAANPEPVEEGEE